MRTEISSLGEFGLIRRLTDGIELKNESSRYGVGDDAAVLSYPTEKQVLITTDLLMEGVHFDLIYVPLKHLGYKAAVVNFSDIYAMNGTPKQSPFLWLFPSVSPWKIWKSCMRASVWRARNMMWIS